MGDQHYTKRASPAALNLSLSTPRRTNPSPLQLSTIPTPITDQFAISSPQELGSPNTQSRQSPRSPALQHASDDYLSPAKHGAESSSSSLTTPRINPSQRAVSGPASMQGGGDSPPPDALPYKSRTELRPTERLVLRTSSIDSTMSTNSSATSGSAPQDPLSPNPSEIQQLITSAGSHDALIRSLLKEKQTAAQQNAQLWRLINKQRHLIVGLNSDLAKAAEDRERYQKRYKELASIMRVPPPQPQVQQLRRTSMSMSSSPARSEEDLPIQRHSVLSPPKVENRRSASVGAEAKTSLKELESLGLVPSESVVSSSETSPSFTSDLQPRATPDSEGTDDDLDSRRNTIMQSHYKPISPIAPLKIEKAGHSISKVTMPSGPPPVLPPIPGQSDSSASPSSFSARRSMSGKFAATSPVVSSPEVETVVSPLRKGPPARLNLQQPSAPPKIALPPRSSEVDLDSDSDYDVEIDEIPAFERGRKKTREEDDREREYIMAKQEASRSQSKPEQLSKSGSKAGSKATTPVATPDMNAVMAKSPAIHAFSPTGSPGLPTSFSGHASLDGMLSARSANEQTTTLTAPPISPGLPRSPRPGDRPHNSPLPRAPNDTHVLSPPLSMIGPLVSPSKVSPSYSGPLSQSTLPQTPTSLSSPRMASSDTVSTVSSQKSPTQSSPLLPPLRPASPLQSPKFMTTTVIAESPKSPTKSSTSSALRSPNKQTTAGSLKSPASLVSTSEALKSPAKDSFQTPPVEVLQRVPSDTSSAPSMTGGIYRGLVSEYYPDLLLPPNALPSISIKVTSSRLRPSRHSIVSMKAAEEEPVFTLGVTARSNLKQLWRVEKPILSLPSLDHQLKQASAFDVRLPDRNLFTGHAPSKIDARRDALEKYFEDVLDTPMNEKAALLLCHFFSAHAIPAEEFDSGTKAGAAAGGQRPIHVGPNGKIMKEGFLTKRGKNFGGWKARYFILDEPVLRYYESPGGTLLGQIKLANAQIGRQSAQSAAASHSPSRSNEDNEKEFRHAFLILEPKKKDSNNMVRHVLCAENDAERDEWVEALLQYIGSPVEEVRPKSSRKMLTSMMKPKDDPSSSRDNVDSLQGVSYDSTLPGQPVRSGPPLENLHSPRMGSFPHNIGQLAGGGKALISAPTGGAIIQDAMAWGNKVPDSPKSRDKEKKRSIWGFRDKADNVSQTSSNSGPPPKASLPAGSKPIFGMPLAEAVETYPARSADMNLPSVVYRCLEYLESKNAASEEGIFRLSGSNLTIKALKDRFNNEGDVDFLADDTYYDVHAIASLLKMYLRELPSSVLGPRELHAQFQSVLELDDRESKIAAYNVLVHRLPPANWTLIRSLSAFLIGIVNNSNVNKMTVRNVGIVFSPTLNIPSPLFAAFLTDFDKIFTAEPPQAAALSPVMEDLEPGFPQFRQHVLQDSRPPQSRDGSVQRRRSRSRTRSRTPDRGTSTDRSYTNFSRPSLEDMRNPPQHSRKVSKEDTAAFVTMLRQQSEEGTSGASNNANLLPPSEIKSKRESMAPGLASTNIMRDAKARRRESSMLLASGMMGAGSRKSSLPQLRNPVDMLYNEDNIRISEQ